RSACPPASPGPSSSPCPLSARARASKRRPASCWTRRRSPARRCGSSCDKRSDGGARPSPPPACGCAPCGGTAAPASSCCSRRSLRGSRLALLAADGFLCDLHALALVRLWRAPLAELGFGQADLV